MREVAGPFHGAHDHRGRAVGLEAAVEEAERLGHPARVEVFVHRERGAAHQGLVVQLRVRAERHRDLAGVRIAGAVELFVPHRDPAVELRGGTRAVREVVVEHRVADRAAVETAPRPGDAFAVAERGVAVPTHGDEDVVGDTRAHRERGVLQRRDRARAAHVHGGREPERVDAEVGGELFARRVPGRRDDPVDVGRAQTGVGDRGVGRLEDQLDGEERRATDIVRLADPHDRRPATKAFVPSVAHEGRTLPGRRSGATKTASRRGVRERRDGRFATCGPCWTCGPYAAASCREVRPDFPRGCWHRRAFSVFPLTEGRGQRARTGHRLPADAGNGLRSVAKAVPVVRVRSPLRGEPHTASD